MTHMQSPEYTEIMIVDDHVVIRSGLRMLIEHDQRMQVVAQAGNRSEALERAASERPDVIILDLVLGDEDGLSFLPELCQASPNFQSARVDRRAKS